MSRQNVLPHSLALAISVFASMPTAFAEQLPIVQNRGLIPLNADASTADANIPYPGLNDAPDCLALTTVGNVPSWSLDLEVLLNKITAENGVGILFSGREIVPMSRVLNSSTLVWGFTERNTFATGVRIRTIGGETLNEAIRASLVNPNIEPPQVFVQRTRDCQ